MLREVAGLEVVASADGEPDSDRRLVISGRLAGGPLWGWRP